MEISDKVKNIIKKSRFEIIDTFEKYNWDMTKSKLAMLLSLVYFPDYKVKFIAVDEKFPVDAGFFPIVETFVNGTVTIYISDSLLKYINNYNNKLGYSKKWNDLENNQFYIDLEESIQKGMDQLSYIKKVLDTIPFLDSSMSIQQHLDWGVEDFIGDAAQEMKDMGRSQISTLYDLFLGKESPITRLFRDGVKKITKKAVKSV